MKFSIRFEKKKARTFVFFLSFFFCLGNKNVPDVEPIIDDAISFQEELL